MNEASKKGTLIEPTTLRFERTLPGPIDRVWDHLTKPELLSTWLAVAASMDLRQGGRVELTMDHGQDDGGLPDAIKDKIVDGDKVKPGVHGTITRLEPKRVLAYTWEDAVLGATAAKSEITFELEPRGDDVLLTFTHRRIDPKYLPQTFAGWHTLLDGLASRMSGEAKFAFFEHFEANLALYTASA
ncbi:MAG: Activator of Hsp90 ATPase 1-like protein [Labilithrix sp.]|nr:Activator of Hsp90 ATPase 1-like protein [Labilithrix sp.]